MFVSLLKERAQQLYNSVEKLTAVMDLERLKYKNSEDSTAGNPETADAGEQPVGHSIHPLLRA